MIKKSWGTNPYNIEPWGVEPLNDPYDPVNNINASPEPYSPVIGGDPMGNDYSMPLIDDLSQQPDQFEPLHGYEGDGLPPEDHILPSESHEETIIENEAEFMPEEYSEYDFDEEFAPDDFSAFSVFEEMKPKKKKKKKKKKKRWKKNKYEYEQWKINNRSESQIYTDSFLEYEYYDEYLEPEDYESEDFTADYSDYPYLPKPRGGKAKRAPMLKRLRNPRLRKKRPKRYRGLRCLRCGKIIEDGIYCVSCSMVMDLLEGKCPLCKEPMENRECKNENCISHEIRE